MIGSLLKYLTSLRFVLILILSLSIIFLLGLWIPQKSLLNMDQYLEWKARLPRLVPVLDALGFLDIYKSPFTLTLWALFFLVLFLVMWQRIPIVRTRISRQPGGPDDAALSQHSALIRLPGNSETRAVREAVERSGYRFFGSGERFFAVKNRLSPLATLLFHLSFFLILLGGCITVYTRFSGTVDLAEGEEFRSELSRYNPGARLPKLGEIPKAGFMVQKIEPEVIQGTPTRLKVTLMDLKRGVQTVEINQPFKIDDTFFVIQSLGVAPLVVLLDGRGKELDGAYVKLNVMKGRQDVFSMADLQFTVNFFPDHVLENGQDATRSDELKNPAFAIEARQGKSVLGRRTLIPGEKVRFGAYQLELREMPFWIRFYVVKERGVGIIYAGFFIGSLGLIWRLVFFRRELAGIVREEHGAAVLHLGGRSEFYKMLFDDEFSRVAGEIETACSSAAGPDNTGNGSRESRTSVPEKV